MYRRNFILFITVLSILFLAGTAEAQTSSEEKAALMRRKARERTLAKKREESRKHMEAEAKNRADKARKFRTEMKAGKGKGKNIMRFLVGTVVKGKVQKPEAMYVLHRSTVSYEVLELKTKMTGKILNSVLKSPF